MTVGARIGVHGAARVRDVVDLAQAIAAAAALPLAVRERATGVDLLWGGARDDDAPTAVLLLDGTADVAAARPADGCVVAILYPRADADAEAVVRDAEVVEGCRAVALSSGSPESSELGLVDDILCDRAFGPDRRTTALELATLADLVGDGDRTLAVEVALAGAGVARAAGVDPLTVRAGLRAHVTQLP